MADETKFGTDWSDDELDAIVADYFAMLALDAADQPFVKVHRARALVAETGRSHKAVEFKHMNISAVASQLGLPTVRGYRPLSNYQAALFPAIDRFLSQHPDAWTIGDDRLLPVVERWGGGPRSGGGEGHVIAPPPQPGVAEPHQPFSSPFHGEGDRSSRRVGRSQRADDREPGLELVEGAAPTFRQLVLATPPAPGEVNTRSAPLQRLIRKYDPAAKDAANRRLGLTGEKHIYDHEIARLIAAERMDLARRVEWTSQERGDGAGYDIRSFDPASGDDRFIEVKTTKGGAKTDFFLSRNEMAFSDEEPDRYRLYRLYDATNDPKLFALKPPLGEAVHLSTETWRAGF